MSTVLWRGLLPSISAVPSLQHEARRPEHNRLVQNITENSQIDIPYPVSPTVAFPGCQNREGPDMLSLIFGLFVERFPNQDRRYRSSSRQLNPKPATTKTYPQNTTASGEYTPSRHHRSRRQWGRMILTAGTPPITLD
ncbi:hypothetical protein B0T21DRAFT_120142 [Apiosordaria backusii]|uniref:Uncharacterized protein n=1 Tax=Apiosordaria backusii TaxID=314023 RepID=A0AA40EM23_9PEZI|nr:hypothetical protein B0T21DRAFT_120142 [Apiosordaria backusii]